MQIYIGIHYLLFVYFLSIRIVIVHDNANTSSQMQVWKLDLPEASVYRTPFAYLELDFNPHGHPPEHVWDKPHLDVHLHMLAKEVVGSIVLGSCSNWNGTGLNFSVPCDVADRVLATVPDRYIPPHHTQLVDPVPDMVCILSIYLSPHLSIDRCNLFLFVCFISVGRPYNQRSRPSI